jgi:hypothetical protein
MAVGLLANLCEQVGLATAICNKPGLVPRDLDDARFHNSVRAHHLPQQHLGRVDDSMIVTREDISFEERAIGFTTDFLVIPAHRSAPNVNSRLVKTPRPGSPRRNPGLPMQPRKQNRPVSRRAGGA